MRQRSIRQRLLLCLAVPLLLVLLIDAWASYRAALSTAQTAFDRLLVTAAHAMADLIWLERGELQVTLPHAALELYAGDLRDSHLDTATRSPLVYRVSFLNGDFLAGDRRLQPYVGLPPVDSGYAARLHLYDTELQGQPMRLVALWQPVESAEGLRYVVVQVGESAAYRFALGRRILWQTLIRQGALMGIVLLVLWLASSAALRPLHLLARRLEQRQADDLTGLQMAGAPREMQPVLAAFNGLLGRMDQAQQRQQRFIADASHQLRTPLAVLQLHTDAGLHGDIPMAEALQQVEATTRRTSRVVHQLLMWNRVQHSPSASLQALDLREVLQEVAVQQSPLLAQKHLDFALDASAQLWSGERWMVEEVLMNLLSNAIRHSPPGASLGMRLHRTPEALVLTVWDSGPGLSAQMQHDLFTPFVSEASQGVGLGLAISLDLARACGGRLEVVNRLDDGRVAGVDARLWLPVRSTPRPGLG